MSNTPPSSDHEPVSVNARRTLRPYLSAHSDRIELLAASSFLILLLLLYAVARQIETRALTDSVSAADRVYYSKLTDTAAKQLADSSTLEETLPALQHALTPARLISACSFDQSGEITKCAEPRRSDLNAASPRDRLPIDPFAISRTLAPWTADGYAAASPMLDIVERNHHIVASLGFASPSESRPRLVALIRAPQARAALRTLLAPFLTPEAGGRLRFAGLVCAVLFLGIVTRARFRSLRAISGRTSDPVPGERERRSGRSATASGPLSTLFEQLSERTRLRPTETKERRHDERMALLNLTHDLRTPLTSMLGFVETLRHRAASISVEDGHRFIDSIDRSIALQQQLLENLLELSGGESAAKVRIETLDLSELLRQIADDFAASATRKSLSLSTEGIDKPIRVACDKTSIRRAVGNLLSNAIRYTPAQGRIVLSAAQHGGAAEIKVRDDGIGIAKEELPHIFEEFYRANARRPEDPGGTGIGLSIVRRIVAAHGGSIAVESELNRGTLFTVTLPLERDLIARRELGESPSPLEPRPKSAAESQQLFQSTHVVGAFALAALAASTVLICILGAIVTLGVYFRRTISGCLAPRLATLVFGAMWAAAAASAAATLLDPSRALAGVIAGYIAAISSTVLAPALRVFYLGPVLAGTGVVLLTEQGQYYYGGGLLLGAVIGMCSAAVCRRTGTSDVWSDTAFMLTVLVTLTVPAWRSVYPDEIRTVSRRMHADAARIHGVLGEEAAMREELPSDARAQLTRRAELLAPQSARSTRIPGANRAEQPGILEDGGEPQAVSEWVTRTREAIFAAMELCRSELRLRLTVSELVIFVLSALAGAAVARFVFGRSATELARLESWAARAVNDAHPAHRALSDLRELQHSFPRGLHKNVAHTLLRMLESTEAEDARQTAHHDERVFFLRQVATELARPLSRARTYLSALRAALSGPREKVVDLTGRLHRQMIRQKRLVDDLFELSMSEAAARELKIEPFECSELIWDAAADYRVDLMEAGIELKMSLPPRPFPLVVGDIDRTVRALYAIFENILSLQAGGGELRVFAADEESGSHLHFVMELHLESSRLPQAHGSCAETTDGDFGLTTATKALAQVGVSLSIARTDRVIRYRLELPRFSDNRTRSVVAASPREQ